MSKQTLIGYLAAQAIAPIEKKGIFAGRYILFGEYLSQAQSLYEISSVLGYTYRDRITIFLELLSQDGRVDDLLKFIATPATERIAKLNNNPQNFHELFFESEGTKLMESMFDQGLIQYSDWNDFPKIIKSKISLKSNYPFINLQMIIAEGIGFGYQYPDVAEKLFSFVYDERSWREAYDAGLNIGSTPPQTISLGSFQSEAKKIIAPFVEKIRPDLLVSLGL